MLRGGHAVPLDHCVSLHSLAWRRYTSLRHPICSPIAVLNTGSLILHAVDDKGLLLVGIKTMHTLLAQLASGSIVSQFEHPPATVSHMIWDSKTRTSRGVFLHA
jgi:hypothetical protein